MTAQHAMCQLEYTLLAMGRLPGCNGGEGVVYEDGNCIPQSIVDTGAAWVINIAVPIASAIFLAFIIWNCLRERRLTWWLLTAVASASTFWLETFGDWGQHLLYTPEVWHYTLPFDMTAPHNPVMMPFLYALYWVAHTWAILKLAQWVMRTRGWGLGKAILVLSAPLTFVWNVIVEGAATYVGLWTYDPPIGPAIDWTTVGGAGYWPLLWPVMLMFGWINLIAYVVGQPEESGRFNRLERFFRLDRLITRPGWSRDELVTYVPASRPLSGGGTVALAVRPQPARAAVEAGPDQGTRRFQAVRVAAWLAFFNVTFALTLDLPLIAVRVIGGLDSPYLP